MPIRSWTWFGPRPTMRKSQKRQYQNTTICGIRRGWPCGCWIGNQPTKAWSQTSAKFGAGSVHSPMVSVQDPLVLVLDARSSVAGRLILCTLFCLTKLMKMIAIWMVLTRSEGKCFQGFFAEVVYEYSIFIILANARNIHMNFVCASLFFWRRPRRIQWQYCPPNHPSLNRNDYTYWSFPRGCLQATARVQQ